MTEVSFMLALQAALQPAWWQAFAIFCAHDAIFLFVPLVLFIYFRKPINPRARHLIKEAAWACLLAFVLAAGTGHIFNRVRPFIVHPQIRQLIAAPLSDTSFPSRHAATAFAIAGILAFISPEIGIIAFLIAILVIFGRVAVGVHYPSDVLAGALLGLACAILIRQLHKSLQERNLRQASK